MTLRELQVTRDTQIAEMERVRAIRGYLRNRAWKVGYVRAMLTASNTPGIEVEIQEGYSACAIWMQGSIDRTDTAMAMVEGELGQ